jgi:hypothetical protein
VENGEPYVERSQILAILVELEVVKVRELLSDCVDISHGEWWLREKVL